MSTRLSLPLALDPLGRLDLTAQAVKQAADSIVMLVGTNPGERPMRPGYGVDLRGYLFAPLSGTDLSLLREQVIRAVSTYVPSARVIDVLATPGRDGSLLQLEVQFQVRLNASTVDGVVHTAVYYPGGVTDA